MRSSWGQSTALSLGAFRLEVLHTTPMEAHLIQRSGRGNTRSQRTDMSLLLLRHQPDGSPSSLLPTLLASSERLMKTSTGVETMLTPGTYTLLPLSLRPPTPDTSDCHEYLLRVGSAKPLLCSKALVGVREATVSLGQHIKSNGECTPAFDGMALYSLRDGCGWLLYAENMSRLSSFTVKIDLSSSFNCLSSRGSLSSLDVLPPGHSQLIHALSFVSELDGSRMAFESQFTSGVMTPEVHSPEVDGLHVPQPIQQSSASGISTMIERLRLFG